MAKRTNSTPPNDRARHRTTPAYFHGPDVSRLHRRHLAVIPYTINRESTMERVIDLGVDGIITDDPDLLALVAKRNGLR